MKRLTKLIKDANKLAKHCFNHCGGFHKTPKDIIDFKCVTIEGAMKSINGKHKYGQPILKRIKNYDSK